MHAPAGVVGPKGSNPFSQPPLVFILSVLKHIPLPSPNTPLPPLSLPIILSLSLSPYLFVVESFEPRVHLLLFLRHFFFYRFFLFFFFFSFMRFFYFVSHPHYRNVSALTFKYSFRGRWVQGNW